MSVPEGDRLDTIGVALEVAAMTNELEAGIDAIVERLRQVSWKERDAVKAELIAATEGDPDRDGVLRKLEDAKRATSDLEVRWEIDEVIEALTPEPEPEPEEEEEPEAEDDGQIRASDFQLVYDDPRGLQLFKHKKKDRWLANQMNPQTGQPMTIELMPQEVEQLKQRLTGSPYWVLGSGVRS